MRASAGRDAGAGARALSSPAFARSLRLRRARRLLADEVRHGFGFGESVPGSALRGSTLRVRRGVHRRRTPRLPAPRRTAMAWRFRLRRAACGHCESTLMERAQPCGRGPVARAHEEPPGRRALGLPPQTTASNVAAEPVRWIDSTTAWLLRNLPSAAPPYTTSNTPASTSGANARLRGRARRQPGECRHARLGHLVRALTAGPSRFLPYVSSRLMSSEVGTRRARAILATGRSTAAGAAGSRRAPQVGPQPLVDGVHLADDHRVVDEQLVQHVQRRDRCLVARAEHQRHRAAAALARGLAPVQRALRTAAPARSAAPGALSSLVAAAGPPAAAASRRGGFAQHPP